MLRLSRTPSSGWGAGRRNCAILSAASPGCCHATPANHPEKCRRARALLLVDKFIQVADIVPDVAGPARLVSLAALVDITTTLAALRQAPQPGRLDAVQGSNGIWRSSRKAIDAYHASQRRRQQRNTAASE